ncbi:MULTISPECIES: helix-turn-helix domain-containing protein [Pontibacillus]|uniref:Helix-turn-helix domain-containing protein n=1 Tax=Pontibacillus marinus BH030004 = DSM 16465 TaxID=1385511 RepID=A0A0A5GFR5_9BACI|nr:MULTISPECIES: helix-turn-helix domain-containing protein [Pontibacillus]KGX90043.1 hypothetical protein N783_02575 [Pontibacillus marinus BH030004 = DSM 16465]QHE50887.1 helix-turn-helix domain-containing protein [Pontibacillus sp. HMF3514]
MNRTEEFTTWESLPETLQAKHIAAYLGISRRRVYELFQIHVEHGGIPNFEIGISKRVEKADLKQWIKQQKEKKTEQR